MKASTDSVRATINEPFKARFLRAVWRITGRKSRLDHFFTTFLKYRKYLPECDAQQVIPRFSETEVRIQHCPIGTWSTPLVDVFVLMKAAQGFNSKRILELGSYRGDTARLLAENTGDQVTICAVDIDERHGSAYQGTAVARKIQRKTGRISTDLFQPDEKFDLIFVDANHDFDSVMNDTQVAFKVLSDPGVILWHDYAAQDNYFIGLNGVPEALGFFSKTYRIYSIRGTRLAMFSNRKDWNSSRLDEHAPDKAGATVWDEKQLRG
jgi:predicted O-methyltransferase YrrM